MLILHINFSGVNAQSLVSYYPEAYHLNIFSYKRKVRSSNLKRKISSDVIGWSPGALSIKPQFSVGNFGQLSLSNGFFHSFETWNVIGRLKKLLMPQEENKMKMKFCANGTAISTLTSWNRKSRKISV